MQSKAPMAWLMLLTGIVLTAYGLSIFHPGLGLVFGGLALGALGLLGIDMGRGSKP